MVTVKTVTLVLMAVEAALASVGLVRSVVVVTCAVKEGPFDGETPPRLQIGFDSWDSQD